MIILWLTFFIIFATDECEQKEGEASRNTDNLDSASSRVVEEVMVKTS